MTLRLLRINSKDGINYVLYADVIIALNTRNILCHAPLIE